MISYKDNLEIVRSEIKKGSAERELGQSGK